MTDHDQRFKALLQEFLAEFFELFFPNWAKQFDFSRVEWLDKELFPNPPEGRRMAADLVAKLPTIEPGEAAKAWLSLIHIEVESADSVVPLRQRMHRYYSYLRDRHQLPVLPVAVYLRLGFEGIGVDEFLEKFGELDVLRFKFLYVGLRGLNGVEYMQQPNDLGVALAALMRLPAENLARIKAEALLRLARSSQTEQRRFLLGECVQTYLNLASAPEQQEFERLLNQEAFEEVKAMSVTWYEQGIEKGIEKGLEKGLEEGKRDLLMVLLQKRFGRLGRTTLERLEQMPASGLSSLAERVLDGHSLHDLGLE